MKLLITYGLSPSLLKFTDPLPSSDMAAILSLDALTISQEVENIRNDRRLKK
jgi:hypothetical protein